MLTMLMPALLAAAPVQAGPLDWMAGAWCSVPDQFGYDCERWSKMDHGMMLGTMQGVRRGKTTDWEFLRVEMDGTTPVFYASVKGTPAVAFRAVKVEPNAVTFENPKHDYPQRVRYWREGDTLKAAISLLNGENEMNWEYKRANE